MFRGLIDTCFITLVYVYRMFAVVFEILNYFILLGLIRLIGETEKWRNDRIEWIEGVAFARISLFMQGNLWKVAIF